MIRFTLILQATKRWTRYIPLTPFCRYLTRLSLKLDLRKCDQPRMDTPRPKQRSVSYCIGDTDDLQPFVIPEHSATSESPDSSGRHKAAEGVQLLAGYRWTEIPLRRVSFLVSDLPADLHDP